MKLLFDVQRKIEGPLSVYLSGNAREKNTFAKRSPAGGIHGNGNGARKSHLQRWQSYRRFYGKLKPCRADRKVASSSSRSAGETRDCRAGFDRDCRAANLSPRVLLYDEIGWRAAARIARRGTRNRDRNKTDARAKRVTQRVTDRCGAAATIPHSSRCRNIQREQEFCFWRKRKLHRNSYNRRTAAFCKSIPVDSNILRLSIRRIVRFVINWRR